MMPDVANMVAGSGLGAGRWRRGVAWGTLVTVAAALLLRRLSGAFVQPLGAAEFTGAALALLALRAAAAPPRWDSARQTWQAAAAAAVALGSISLPGTSWGALAAGWASWLVAELIQCSPARQQRAAAAWGRLALRVRGALPASAGWQSPGAAAAAEPTLRQELRRLVDPSGSSVVHARLIEPLVDGQLLLTLHVAIAPPLPGAPSLQWEQVAGPPARWSAPLALPHGFRLEGKLASPAAPGDRVEIEVQATSAAR